MVGEEKDRNTQGRMKKRFFVIFILQRILYGVVFLMFTLR
jgi:hypothetical protein